jgi:hypothetical protein
MSELSSNRKSKFYSTLLENKSNNLFDRIPIERSLFVF